MSHLEAVHGVVGHAHLSPLKVGDSGGPFPSAALGASELRPPPRAGRARAIGGGRLGQWGWGLGSWGLGEVVSRGLETPGSHREETVQESGSGCRAQSQDICVCACAHVCVSVSVSVCLSVCMSVRPCVEICAKPRPSSFLHTPHLFLCPELSSELLLPSFALVPSLPPPLGLALPVS